MELTPVVQGMVGHQIRVGGVEEGDELILKVGGDGTLITKKSNATVHTVTLSNAEKALQISTLAIVLGPEEYEVRYQKQKLCG